MTSIACPTSGELAAFRHGDCTEARSDQIRRHVESCARCARWLADAELDEAALAGVRSALELRTRADRGTPGSDSSELQATVDVSNRPPLASLAAMPTIEGYELLREISRGGQGVIYQAIQKVTKQKVAIKVMLQGTFASRTARARFEREVELAASLKHPNIVPVYDSGVANDCPYYVMEYIRGQRLDEYIAENELSSRGALRLSKTICAAVAYAHQNGVIHRDLKPGNILVDGNGEPHIVDFGLAKMAGPDVTANGMPISITGDFVGTLAYASPEQTSGDPSQVDVRTDVYALGVILYEMLTGHYPYPVVGHMAEVLRNILEAVPERPSTWYRQSRQHGKARKPSRPYKIDDELETIVLKALAKEKERRYQSAEHLARDLDRYLLGQPIEAKQDSALYVLRKLARRHLYATVTLGALVVTIISAAVVSFDYYRDARRALTEKEKSHQVLADRNKQLEAMRDGTHPAARYKVLASFLAGYREDGPDYVPKSNDQATDSYSPENRAIAFMLDESYTLDRLLADLPPEYEALAYLAAAERHLRAGRRTQAVEAYETAIISRGHQWVKSVCHARLHKLRHGPAGTAETMETDHDADRETSTAAPSPS